ncbi:hypothetical protein ACWEJQ_27500 [Streptomyces albidoflavus]
MTWSTLAATAVGTVLGVLATLFAEHVRRRGDRTDHDRETLRTAFSAYLTALSTARDAFIRAEPAPERVGKGHIAISEHGVYAERLQLDLVAPRTLTAKTGPAVDSVLDLHDAVVAGHAPDSPEYLRAWRAARRTRAALIEEMRKSLQRP